MRRLEDEALGKRPHIGSGWKGILRRSSFGVLGSLSPQPTLGPGPSSEVSASEVQMHPGSVSPASRSENNGFGSSAVL